ncbi:hypothetical protein [Bacillus thuringiensis]|uniref:hypothetical protein n=1 Tax=Bacillus thuringiensis TaxID=1428 RepID=UPI0011A184F3|nr:hypothetical protein [Bacillus thuringiensis]
MKIELPEIYEMVEVEIRKSDELNVGDVCAVCRVPSENIHFELIAQKDCVIKWYVPENEVYKTLCSNETIGEVYCESMKLDINVLGLWMSSHSAFRSLQAKEGEGGQVAASALPVSTTISLGDSFQAFITPLKNFHVEHGDTIVIADKAIAIALNRIIPINFLEGRDPKFLDLLERIELSEKIKEKFNTRFNVKQLLLIDYLNNGTASLGGIDHNNICSKIAKLIYEEMGVYVDVVIADSDTGVDKGEPIIGIPTVGVTPLGATAGLSVYEAMRVSAVGEYIRGHNRNIPIVICKASKRNSMRKNISQARWYPGTLNVFMESEFHYGLKTILYWRKKG